MPYRTSPSQSSTAASTEVVVAPRFRPRRILTTRIRHSMFVIYALGVMACALVSLQFEVFVSTLLLAVSVGLCVAHFVNRRRLVRQSKALAAKNEEGIVLLARGDLEGAIHVFDQIIGPAAAFPVNHGIFVLNRAVARTRQGALDEALAHLLAVERGGSLGGAAYTAQRAMLYTQLTYVSGLRGEVEEGHRWLEKAKGTTSLRMRPILFSHEAILEARSGRYAAAAERLERGWAEAEAILAAAQIKPLAIFRAFCLGRAHADGSRDEEIRALVTSAKGAPVESYAHHAVVWPELAEFHEKQGLGALAPPAALET